MENFEQSGESEKVFTSESIQAVLGAIVERKTREELHLRLSRKFVDAYNNPYLLTFVDEGSEKHKRVEYEFLRSGDYPDGNSSLATQIIKIDFDGEEVSHSKVIAEYVDGVWREQE